MKNKVNYEIIYYQIFDVHLEVYILSFYFDFASS